MSSNVHKLDSASINSIQPEREAYVTMVTNKDYVVGALVLAHSLRGTGTKRPILCMVTKTLDNSDLEQLKLGGLQPFVVEHIPASTKSDIKEWDDVGLCYFDIFPF